MKIKKHLSIFFIAIVGILLAACSAGIAPTTYPGLTISNDVAYIASAGQVRAVNLTDGTIPWRFPADKPDGTRLYYATPIVSEDRIYIANYKGEVYALDLKGTATWNAPFSVSKGRWYTAPILYNNELFGANGDGAFYAIKLDGTLDWQITKDAAQNQLGSDIPWGDFWSSPVADEATGILYQLSLNHYLYAIDTKLEKALWAMDIKAPAITQPVIHEGYVYFGTLNGDLFKISTTNRQDATIKNLDGEIWSKPAFWNTNIFIGTKTGTTSGKLFMLNINDLSEAASATETVSPVTVTGVPIPDGVVFGTENGSFYRVNNKGEAFIWPNTIPGNVYTDPVYSSEKLWVAVFGGEDILRYFNSAGNLSESFKISAQ
jgi:outer membrane protein assembly factor BamB